jgi:hypothetical protein
VCFQSQQSRRSDNPRNGSSFSETIQGIEVNRRPAEFNARAGNESAERRCDISTCMLVKRVQHKHRLGQDSWQYHNDHVATVAGIEQLSRSVCSLDAQTWSAPVFVENGGGATVSTNANGTEAVIYAGLAAVKTGGVWRTPVLLGSGSPASDIKVAPNGDVLAIWSFRTSNTYVPVEAQAAFFSGGRWGPTWTITTSEYGNVYNFGSRSIGFDGNNQATVVWEEYNGSTCSVVAVTGTAAAGFGSRQTLSNESTCQGWTQLAVNHVGQAVAVIGLPRILSGPVVAISRNADGTWHAPVTLEAQQYRQRQPRIGLGDDGHRSGCLDAAEHGFVCGANPGRSVEHRGRAARGLSHYEHLLRGRRRKRERSGGLRAIPTPRWTVGHAQTRGWIVGFGRASGSQRRSGRRSCHARGNVCGGDGRCGVHPVARGIDLEQDIILNCLQGGCRTRNSRRGGGAAGERVERGSSLARRATLENSSS